MLVAFACSEEKEDVDEWSRLTFKRTLDSLGKPNLGCYKEPSGFFILEFDASQKFSRKLTYRKGFPVYIDTLSLIKPREFKSTKEDVVYFVKDTSVISIHYVKIFHPNSNLRGQTPWIQPYVYNYKRLNEKAL
jgi:hypothetical protein